MHYEISRSGVLLARLIRSKDIWDRDELGFYSDDEEFVQVGSWNYPEGRDLLPHKHNEVPRTISHTQEVVYVKEGSLRAYVYDFDGSLVEELTLFEGDVIIMLNGGHGYKVLQDSTKVLEVKNGPYLGAEIDRVRLE